jgi:transposase-like protein
MPAPLKPDWLAIEGSYRSGKGSLREIAGEHGITEGTIRARAKKNGWIRDPEGTKRERVKSLMAGVTASVTQDALRNMEDEAKQDVIDMRMGLEVARQVLARLLDLVGQVAEARDIKVIAEANRIAVDTIRRIRGLDESTGQAAIVIERSFGR